MPDKKPTGKRVQLVPDSAGELEMIRAIIDRVDDLSVAARRASEAAVAVASELHRLERDLDARALRLVLLAQAKQE